MKKALFSCSFIFCVALNAQTIVSTEPSQKNVILEEFTGVNCVNCPDGHKIANQIITNNPGRCFSINIHQGNFANSTPDYRTEFGDDIAAQAGVNAYPLGTVNRHVFSGSNTCLDRSAWTNRASQILAQDSYVNIAAVSTIDAITRELTVTVELFYTDDAAVETNFLNVALLQNNILGPQLGMNFNPEQIIGGKYNHQHMLRHLLTGQWGDEIETTSEGSFVSKTYAYLIPEHLRNVIYDIENLEVLVFVAETTQEIITGTKSNMQIINGKPIIKTITEIETYSCNPEILICAKVFNFSDEDVTQLSFTYKIDEGQENTYTWDQRSIAPMETDTVHFCLIPVISGNEYEISATITNYNNDNEIIGALPAKITIQKTIVNAFGDNFAFIIATDRYASQTSYKFFDCNGNVVLSRGPWTDLQNNGTTVRQELFAPPASGCYKLEVYDTGGNGINSGYGPGYFKLIDSNDNVVFENDGKFGYQANYHINVNPASSIEIYKIENEIVIFPNPVKDELTVFSSQFSVEGIEIFDVHGRNIQSKIYNLQSEYIIDVSKLTNGIYFINIKTDKGIVYKKFIKR